MIEHVSLGTHSFAAAVGFYESVLAPLGMTLQRRTGGEAAFGDGPRWAFFLYPVPADDGVRAPGMHVAFAAPSRTSVAAVHRTALAAGAADLFAPRLRPDISATYYGAMFTDRDGHRIEVMTNAP